MIKYIAKKYVCNMINGLLEDYAENVDKVKITLTLWIARIDKVLFALRSILSKLDDNKLTDDEIQSSIDEVKNVVNEW